MRRPASSGRTTGFRPKSRQSLDSSLEHDGPADPKMGAGAAVLVENGPKTYIVVFRIWARLLRIGPRRQDFLQGSRCSVLTSDCAQNTTVRKRRCVFGLPIYNCIWPVGALPPSGPTARSNDCQSRTRPALTTVGTVAVLVLRSTEPKQQKL